MGGAFETFDMMQWPWATDVRRGGSSGFRVVGVTRTAVEMLVTSVWILKTSVWILKTAVGMQGTAVGMLGTAVGDSADLQPPVGPL